MGPPVAVLVTGSRRYGEQELIRAGHSGGPEVIRAVLGAELRRAGRLIVRHGACPDGADAIAAAWCAAHRDRVTEDACPAFWGRCGRFCPAGGHMRRARSGRLYCPDGGFRRNHWMTVKAPVPGVCLAFAVDLPDCNRGTRDCAWRAREAGIHLEIRGAADERLLGSWKGPRLRFPAA